jgi:hypothetical protein
MPEPILLSETTVVTATELLLFGQDAMSTLGAKQRRATTCSGAHEGKTNYRRGTRSPTRIFRFPPEPGSYVCIRRTAAETRHSFAHATETAALDSLQA